MVKLVLSLAVVGLQFYGLHYLRTDPVIPDRTTFAGFPREFGGWECRNPEELSADVMESLKATDYFSCVYLRETTRASPAAIDGSQPRIPYVHLYIGYHAAQAQSGGTGAGMAAIHPPEHCLPGSGWDIVDARTLPVVVDGEPGEAKRFVIAKGDYRNLVYFWYQSRGRVIASNYDKIFYTFWDRTLRGRTDGALVRLTVPIPKKGPEAADAAIADLMAEVGPHLDAYVPD